MLFHPFGQGFPSIYLAFSLPALPHSNIAISSQTKPIPMFWRHLAPSAFVPFHVPDLSSLPPHSYSPSFSWSISASASLFQKASSAPTKVGQVVHSYAFCSWISYDRGPEHF